VPGLASRDLNFFTAERSLFIAPFFVPAAGAGRCVSPGAPNAHVQHAAQYFFELIAIIFMLRFPLPKLSKSSQAEITSAGASTVKTGPAKSTEAHPLDGLTGGAFSAPTSGERAARIRQWLATGPTAEQMAEVFKDLANRDKGAAKPLKEKLDEIKRAKGQEAVAAEWAVKAQALLALPKLNLADALAWQRDAAKAGAPLSKEPLASLKVQLAERVKTIEDLQHRTQVQREAAVLIAQRLEVLSIKPWRDAEAALETLRADVAHWQAQASEIAEDANWASVDVKFPPLLDASRSQLLAVWDAFQGALAMAVKAADDAAAPLPAVPVWADELRMLRGGMAAPDGESTGEQPARAPKVKIDPALLKEMREKAAVIVQTALEKLEHEVTEGHGKATPKVAAELRHVLKEHIRHMVGGHSKLAQDERLLRFVFPERPGALLKFLSLMRPGWNISLFHYRNQGADYGRILVGLQVPKADNKAFKEFLDTLGYPHVEETDNPVYRLFLQS